MIHINFYVTIAFVALVDLRGIFRIEIILYLQNL